ncbi:MAG: alpha/beta hydrolase [Phycisphaerae bacterium]
MPDASSKSWPRRLQRIGMLVVAIYATWLIAACSMQQMLMYPGAGVAMVSYTDPPIPVGWEQWWLQPQPGVRVEAWFAPGCGRSAESPGPAVLVGHGNYEIIDFGDYFAEQFAERGVSCVLVEFRGFGRSTGSPSQEAITADFVAYYDRLIARPEVDASKVVLYGRSLGAAAVVQVAARRPSVALLLDSPFSSASAMAARMLAPPQLLRDHWRSDLVLAKYASPILIMHGRNDPTIPISHARELKRIAPHATLVEHDGGHTDLAGRNFILYWKSIDETLRAAGVSAKR